MLTIALSLAIFCGCTEAPTTAPAAAVSDSEAFSDAVRETLNLEIQTLQAGILSLPDRKLLVEKRIDFLTGVIDGKKGLTLPDDNSTKEGCLFLEAQMSALVVGGGTLGTADRFASRISRLRALLKQAGYDFDERGFEQAFDDSGTRREGYTPLLD